MLASVLLSACAFDKITLPAGASRVVVHGVHAPKRSMDMAKAIETDSNINQINQMLSNTINN